MAKQKTKTNFENRKALVLKMVPNFAGHDWEQVAQLSGVPPRDKKSKGKLVPMSAGENAEGIYRSFIGSVENYVGQLREAAEKAKGDDKQKLLSAADSLETRFITGLEEKRSAMLGGVRGAKKKQIDVDSLLAEFGL